MYVVYTLYPLFVFKEITFFAINSFRGNYVFPCLSCGSLGDDLGCRGATQVGMTSGRGRRKRVLPWASA